MRVGFPGKVLQLKSEEDSLDVFIFHYIKRKVKAREAVRGQSRYVVLLQKSMEGLQIQVDDKSGLVSTYMTIMDLHTL
jgi:hypothetical protein